MKSRTANNNSSKSSRISSSSSHQNPSDVQNIIFFLIFLASVVTTCSNCVFSLMFDRLCAQINATSAQITYSWTVGSVFYIIGCFAAFFTIRWFSSLGAYGTLLVIQGLCQACLQQVRTLTQLYSITVIGSLISAYSDCNQMNWCMRFQDQNQSLNMLINCSNLIGILLATLVGSNLDRTPKKLPTNQQVPFHRSEDEKEEEEDATFIVAGSWIASCGLLMILVQVLQKRMHVPIKAFSHQKEAQRLLTCSSNQTNVKIDHNNNHHPHDDDDDDDVDYAMDNQNTGKMIFVTLAILMLSLQGLVENNLTIMLPLLISKSYHIAMSSAARLANVCIVSMTLLRLVASHPNVGRYRNWLLFLNLTVGPLGLWILWRCCSQPFQTDHNLMAASLLLCAVGQFSTNALMINLLNDKLPINHVISLVLQFCGSLASIGNSSLFAMFIETRPAFLWFVNLLLTLVQTLLFLILQSMNKRKNGQLTC